jgi:5-methylcytosine-specific restriction endonuclease McrA
MVKFSLENMPLCKGIKFRKWAIDQLKRHGVDFPMHKYTNKTLLGCLMQLAEGVPSENIGNSYKKYQEKIKLSKKNKQIKPKPDKQSALSTTNKTFYDTREWKELRYQALKIYGPRCQCCGASPADGIVIHVDHIKPRSKYPELELDIKNLQILCEPCNIGKSNKDDTDWRC